MEANELLKEGSYAHFLNSESLWKRMKKYQATKEDVFQRYRHVKVK